MVVQDGEWMVRVGRRWALVVVDRSGSSGRGGGGGARTVRPFITDTQSVRMPCPYRDMIYLFMFLLIARHLSKNLFLDTCTCTTMELGDVQ